MALKDKVFEKAPCMKFTLTDTKPSVFESKVGGVGYVPRDGEVPVGEGGAKMQFLAQVNCADLDLEDFPKSGLLQFWILEDDFGLGREPCDPTTNRVVYYSEDEIDRTVTEDEARAKTEPVFDEDYFPVKGEYGMAFEKVMDENYVYTEEEIDEWFKDKTIELKENSGHKVGGFGRSEQVDPKETDPSLEAYSVLLFQLDSDCEENEDGDYIERVMWCDGGVGNFYIKPEDLKALDFSDVLYNWDCG